MKKTLFISFITIVIATCLLSCSVDGKRERSTYSYGLFQTTGSDNYIICDDNAKMLIINSNNLDNYIGKRVFVTGELKTKAPNGYNSVLSLKLIEEVQECKLQIVNNSSVVDATGNLGIFTDSYAYYNTSFFGKYFNFIFNIVAQDPKKHIITYLFDASKEEVAKNKATLYIRHNSVEEPTDKSKQPYKIYTSVDISKIFELRNEDKITLTINYINMYNKKIEETIEVIRN